MCLHGETNADKASRSACGVWLAGEEVLGDRGSARQRQSARRQVSTADINRQCGHSTAFFIAVFTTDKCVQDA